MIRERFLKISRLIEAMRKIHLLLAISALSAGLMVGLVSCGPDRPEAAQEAPNPMFTQLIVEKIEPEKALPGQPFPVEILIRNLGEEPLFDLEVTLDLPEGLRLVSSEPPTEGGVWYFKELPVGSELRIHLRLEGEAGEFPNTVRVRASRPISAQVSGTVALSPIPGLTAYLGDSPGVIPVGGKVTYSLLIRGQGYGKAEGVSVQFELPEGMTLESVEAPIDHALEGRELDFEPFELGAGEEVLIKVVLVAEEAGDAVVRALIAYQGFAHRLVIEEGTVIYGG